jgi:GrpB-like predicted nucleotidyltransferase (UPF0157 family)
MPPPFAVKLQPHDGGWQAAAEAERKRLLGALSSLEEIHHIGSTAIPGIVAKPIVDLLGTSPNLSDLDAERPLLESLGYAWHGQYGLTGRRYCTLTDASTGERRVQLHCYARNEPSITRHLAFRDYLRARPDIAAAYGEEKMRCARLNPFDSHAYAECKSPWIKRIEAEALRALGL